jgi:ATP-binding protein involved in chromosome partitioning
VGIETGSASAHGSTSEDGTALQAAISAALATVIDPEIRKPITELEMVERVTVASDGATTVRVLLTVAGCPMKEKLTTDVTAAVSAVAGVSSVKVDLGVMNDAQRTELRTKLRGDNPVNEIPFAQPGSRTRVYAVASGKGGVGKSSVTVNLAVALAQRGLEVGVLDADIYGFSVPRMLGVTGKPTQVEKMIMPPQAHGVKVISIGMFTPGNTAVVWRGPMLHRALQQFLADVFWGDLDVLLMDLPPGTGDIAISLAQLVPSAELLVVTTPQLAAREVAERAGSIALQTHQQIVGVVENMSWLDLPDGSRMELFGAGGGAAAAASLAESTGTKVGLLGQVPIDMSVREGGDSGDPIVLTHPESAAAKAFGEIADTLAGRQTSLVGRSLGLSPASR